MSGNHFHFRLTLKVISLTHPSQSGGLQAKSQIIFKDLSLILISKDIGDAQYVERTGGGDISQNWNKTLPTFPFWPTLIPPVLAFSKKKVSFNRPIPSKL